MLFLLFTTTAVPQARSLDSFSASRLFGISKNTILLYTGTNLERIVSPWKCVSRPTAVLATLAAQSGGLGDWVVLRLMQHFRF